MSRSKTIAKSNDKNDFKSRLRELLIPESEVKKIIEKIDPKCGEDALPIAELRLIVDEEMGQDTLTAELYRMREER